MLDRKIQGAYQAFDLGHMAVTDVLRALDPPGASDSQGVDGASDECGDKPHDANEHWALAAASVREVGGRRPRMAVFGVSERPSFTLARQKKMAQPDPFTR